MEMNNWQEKKRDYFQLVDHLGSPEAEATK
jgi:hypothetical protein